MSHVASIPRPQQVVQLYSVQIQISNHIIDVNDTTQSILASDVAEKEKLLFLIERKASDAERC